MMRVLDYAEDQAMGRVAGIIGARVVEEILA
jgi:hypothetical protein